MYFPQLEVSTDDDEKGRTFTAHLVAYVLAPKISPPSSKGFDRPVLLAYAGTPSTLNAFTANLRNGVVTTCDTHHWRFELLKTSEHRYLSYRPADGQALVIAYLPEPFHLRPGAGGLPRIQFVSAPPTWWIDAQEAQLTEEFGDTARQVARAAAFVARLNARTPLPILNDARFHHALYERALEQPWVLTPGSRSSDLCAWGLDRLGLDAPLFCDVTPETLQEFLGRATTELLPDLLSDLPALAPPPEPVASGHQLALTF